MRAPAERTERPTKVGGAAGFTMIELMVVVFIVALLFQLVTFNMGALVPGSLLDTEAKKFIASFDYLRSEAKIQGKPYKLQVDLSRHRWRTVLPPEDRLTTEQAVPEEVPLEWSPLDERVRYLGFSGAGNPPARQGIVDIELDENGNTADQALSFRLREDDQKVWTVQIRGLTGETRLVKNQSGREAMLEATKEADF